MEKKEYRNYLFDLYGTLVDIQTDESSRTFWQRVCWLLGMRGINCTPKELKARYRAQITAQDRAARETLPADAEPEIDIAIVFRDFLESSGNPVTDAEIADFAKTFRLLSLKKLSLFPGADTLLDRLHAEGKKVYLLSNAQSLFTRPELTMLGLEQRFDGILLSSEAGRKKPDPEFYHMLMSRYGLAPSETVMVGNDDICDCHGAARAGLDSCYICTAQSPALSGPLPENCRQISAIADAADI